MKRYGYLYEQIISIENCRNAILNASKKKKKRKNVQRILANLDDYAVDLSERLSNLDFTTPYITRTIVDGLSGKERELQIPSFYPDQCAHHAIVQIIQPIIMKSSYYWSCANIKNRGMSRAAIGVERATKRDLKHAKYCVKLDIRKFYPSIPHDKLKARLREKIKDVKALAILDKVIDTFEHGIPIGNYTSPWFAEFFLQPVDWFIKQVLKIPTHVRYADDIVLIDNNKRRLRKALHRIIEFVKGLGVELKGNYQLFKIQKREKGKRKHGRKIDFVGRCFGRGFTKIRKRRALAIMRQSRYIQKLIRKGKIIPYKVAAGFISRCSCFKHTDSVGMKKKYYDTVNIKLLKEVIRNESKRKCAA